MLTTNVLRLWCWHNFVNILQWGKKVVYSAAKILLSPKLFTNHFFGIESFNRQEPAQTYTEWVWCLWKFCVFECVCVCVSEKDRHTGRRDRNKDWKGTCQFLWYAFSAYNCMWTISTETFIDYKHVKKIKYFLRPEKSTLSLWKLITFYPNKQIWPDELIKLKLSNTQFVGV